jgi:tetratricopeptide (TPR) repeat protein
MLETIRMFARDQLAAMGELAIAQERHAHVFLDIAEEQAPRFDGSHHLEARQRIDIEHDNMREALAWVVGAEPSSGSEREQGSFGLRLAAALEPFWRANSYYREGAHWLQAAIDRSHGDREPNLARCLAMLANFLVRLGDYRQGRGHATASVEIWRRLGDVGGLAQALRTLGNSLEYAGDAQEARPAYEEALQAARASNDPILLHRTLGYVAAFEASEHDDTRALELDTEALEIARDLGDVGAELAYQHNIACTLRILGRVDEADGQMRGLIPRALRDSEPAELAYFAEDYAAVCAELGRHESAVRLLGAAEAWRAELGTPRPRWQEAEIASAIERSALALSAEEWKRSYRRGRDTAIEIALAEAAGVLVRS